jgi:hypothetical protein
MLYNQGEHWSPLAFGFCCDKLILPDLPVLISLFWRNYSKKLTASKDLVIWRDGLDTVWGENWQVSNSPWVVMEWKTKRTGKPNHHFDSHDIEWLSGFTNDYPGTFGYLVHVYDGPYGRTVDWTKVRQGIINNTNRRS